MRKNLKIILLILLTGAFFGSAYYGYSMYTTNRESTFRAFAQNQLALLSSGEAATLYDSTSSGLKANVTQESFIASFSGLSSSTPEMLPGQLKLSGSRATYRQRVGNLPPTASGRTTADFTMEYIKEGSWKLHAVTVK